MSNNRESEGRECPLRDPLEELAEWAESNAAGRKLSFSERCGIAWALHSRIKTRIVMDAFGLSRATVSMLRHCLKPGRNHYRDVHEELLRIGPEKFIDDHYRPIHMRLKRVALNLSHLPGGELDRAPVLAYDSRSNRYAGPFTMEDGSRWEVFLREGEGWFFKMEGQQGHFGTELGGVDWEDATAFSTPGLAFDGAHEFNGFESPRPKPGRSRKK